MWIFSGNIGAGKSTMIDKLIKNHGSKFVNITPRHDSKELKGMLSYYYQKELGQGFRLKIRYSLLQIFLNMGFVQALHEYLNSEDSRIAVIERFWFDSLFMYPSYRPRDHPVPEGIITMTRDLTHRWSSCLQMNMIIFDFFTPTQCAYNLVKRQEFYDISTDWLEAIHKRFTYVDWLSLSDFLTNPLHVHEHERHLKKKAIAYYASELLDSRIPQVPSEIQELLEEIPQSSI